MSIRNSTEVGENLLKIAKYLLSNKRLCRLLKYSDQNPLSKELHQDIPIEQILHKNIKVVPLVNEQEDNTESTIVIVFNSGEVDSNNSEFKNLSFDILIYVPLSEWILNDVNLRPFLIISEVEKSLKNKKVESLGTIKYQGFELNLITDIMSCYRMRFYLDVFN